MRLVFLIISMFFISGISAQSIGQFRYDTTVFLKVGGNNEVKIQNGSRNEKGLFTNVGDGLGRWIKPRMNGDTLFIGVDTFLVAGGSSIKAANGLTLANDTVKLGGTLIDTTSIIVPKSTRLRFAANGATPYTGSTVVPPWFYFNASDTVNNNVFDSAGTSFSARRETFFNTNRRDYFGSYSLHSKLMTKDSTYLYSVGGDFGYNLKSTREMTRSASSSNRSVWRSQEASNSTDWEANPNIIAWDYHRRPSGSPYSHRSRGTWAGISSYLIMDNVTDTVDGYIGFISMSRLNSNNKVMRHIDYWAGGAGGYSTSVVDSTWSLFSRYPQPTLYHKGKVSIGAGSGPTEQLELAGNFKHYSLRSGDETDSMVVWNPTTQLYGKRPVPSGGGSTSPAGSNTEIQYNNAGSFGASSGFTYNGTAVTINSGSDVNSPNAFILGTGSSRRATLGVGASNHFYIQNTHASDANAGIVLRNRTGANMATFSTGGSTLNTSIRYPTTQVSANYSVSVSTDYIIEVTANDPTLTLPSATSQNGLTYKFVNTGAGTAVIQTTSSQVIGNSGSATSINLTAGSALELTAINGAWRIF